MPARLRPGAAVPGRGTRPAWPAADASPTTFAVIVVDNGSTRRHRRGRPLARRARWCARTGPGTARPCTPGCWRRRPTYLAVMDGDGSFDPADLLPLLDGGPRRPRRHGDRPPPAGRAAACGPGTRAPATSPCCGGCAAGPVCRCTTSRRCGCAAAQACSASTCEDRRFGYPVELLQKAHAAPAGGSPSTTSPTARAPRAPARRCRARCAGTVRAARDFARVLS